MWLRGDLNLQAKSLMLLGSIPPAKANPSNLLRLLGFFFANLGCREVQPPIPTFADGDHLTSYIKTIKGKAA
jgi:hypothetical protein